MSTTKVSEELIDDLTYLGLVETDLQNRDYDVLESERVAIQVEIIKARTAIHQAMISEADYVAKYGASVVYNSD